MSVKSRVAIKARVEGGENLRVLTKICMIADVVDGDRCREGDRMKLIEKRRRGIREWWVWLNLYEGKRLTMGGGGYL
jgi:hypothetical protein